MQKIAADLTSSSQAKINQPCQSSLSQGHSDLVSEPLAVEVTLSAQNPFEASSNHSISMRLSLESGSFSYKTARSRCKPKGVDLNSNKYLQKGRSTPILLGHVGTLRHFHGYLEGIDSNLSRFKPRQAPVKENKKNILFPQNMDNPSVNYERVDLQKSWFPKKNYSIWVAFHTYILQ